MAWLLIAIWCVLMAIAIWANETRNLDDNDDNVERVYWRRYDR